MQGLIDRGILARMLSGSNKNTCDMKKKSKSLIKQGKKVGRPALGEDVKGKLTLSIDREAIASARAAFPGELSGMVEGFLLREIKGKGRDES